MILSSFRIVLAALLLALAAAAGCSDNAPGQDAGADASDANDGAGDAVTEAAPLPDEVVVTSGETSVRYEPKTGRLQLLHRGTALTEAAPASGDDALAPIAFGSVDPYNPVLYYNPAKIPSTVSFAALGAARAVTSEGERRIITFAGGASIELAPSKVTGAVSLRIKGIAPQEATGPQTVLTRHCLAAQSDELFFGFGEVFDTVGARGVVREMQILVDTSSDTGLNEVHVPVPFALSPRGWAMLVNDFHAGAFDVAAARDDRICATFHTHELEVLLMTDDRPLALVERLVALTSKPALPPRWAFGLQQWRNALANQQELLDDAKAMRDNNVPASVVWIDNPWQTGYNTFEFDTNQFPDIAGTISSLAADGYKVLLWSTPNLDTKQTALYQQAAQGGFLMKGTDGKPIAYKWGASDNGTLVDFSAPGAQAFWRTLIKKVTDLGVSGFKLDYGEEAVVAIGAVLAPFRFHGDRDTQTMHREFPRLYHDTYLGALAQGDGFLITRAGSLGEQDRNTAIWPGDLDSNFDTHADGRVGGLPAAITAGLSLSLSGYPFFGSDIGGFRKGLPTSECLERWADYAALGTIMQLGGGGKSHNPWDTTLFDAETLGRVRRAARLHTDLFPTIYSLAVEASKTGRPVNRPLALAYHDDKQTWTRHFTFMLGDDILVAPVITAGAVKRKVYLPEGTWVHQPSRAIYTGKQEVEVDAPRGELPLFYRQGALIGMLATAVDTLAPATAAGVVSYEAHRSELALLFVPGAQVTRTFFDGTQVVGEASGSEVRLAITPGSQHSDFRPRIDWLRRAAGPATPATVTVDGTALPAVSSEAETATCAGGCYFYDAANGWLYARVLGAGTLSIK
ncbi:MAG: glycoside hydrolase family 31 protein [Myxococcales bacterium]|nr:glycoside hydrolase family 31 protein [Myxococcales bacterium]